MGSFSPERIAFTCPETEGNEIMVVPCGSSAPIPKKFSLFRPTTGKYEISL